jgi:arylsulfatase A-like enzyme
MYEESIRVPLIVVDPRLPEESRGKVSDALALNLDVAPTMLDFAGVDAPARMQGKSLRPLLRDPRAGLRDDFFYEHRYRTPGHPIERTEGVRGTRWKYIRFIDQDPVHEELYDLEADPHETRNLAADPAHRATLERLRVRWREYVRTLV